MTAELRPQPLADADAKEINDLHNEIVASVKMTLPKAIRIGELLTARKNKEGHGDWLPWLDANVQFSQQSASVYMRIFEHRGKLPISGNLTEALKLLNDAEPTKRKRTGLKSKTDRSKSRGDFQNGESQNGGSQDKEGSSQNASTLSVDPTIIEGLMKKGFNKAQAIDFATKSAQQAQGVGAPETGPEPSTESVPESQPKPERAKPASDWWAKISPYNLTDEQKHLLFEEIEESFEAWLKTWDSHRQLAFAIVAGITQREPYDPTVADSDMGAEEFRAAHSVTIEHCEMLVEAEQEEELDKRVEEVTEKKSAPERAPATAWAKASPLVREYAREHDIDLDTVKGTGPDGAVILDDVQDPNEESFAVAATDTRAYAQEHNIDLGKIKGTGLEGQITVGDVIRAKLKANKPAPAKPVSDPEPVATPTASKKEKKMKEVSVPVKGPLTAEQIEERERINHQRKMAKFYPELAGRG